MCLWIKDKKALIAEKDIVCYKKLEELKRANGEIAYYITPYMFSSVDVDMVSGKKPFKAKCIGYGGAHRRKNGVGHIIDEKGVSDKHPEYNYSIKSGYIHTYQDFKAACDGLYESDRIFECIIPKGTKYYAGIFDGGAPSYASKEIVFKGLAL